MSSVIAGLRQDPMQVIYQSRDFQSFLTLNARQIFKGYFPSNWIYIKKEDNLRFGYLIPSKIEYMALETFYPSPEVSAKSAGLLVTLKSLGQILANQRIKCVDRRIARVGYEYLFSLINQIDITEDERIAIYSLLD